jgi:hypothetical protein
MDEQDDRREMIDEMRCLGLSLDMLSALWHGYGVSSG